MNNLTLQDKIAFVTGAASGIGKEIASTYARAGARVAIADMNRDAAETAAAGIRATGASAMAVAADVTDEAQVNAAVRLPSGRRCWPSTSTALSSPPRPACRTCMRRAEAAA